ncbi:MAG: ATPase domain-containing protein [Candidatus Woesearchaeota archaeon]
MAEKKTEEEDIRVPSGIKELDKIIEGGFEKNSAVLVVGGGGSGKTIMGAQFLMEGILNNDETGIYISFEESKEKFYRHMGKFGWNLKELEEKGRFVFVTFSPSEMVEIVKSEGKVIEKDIKEVNAKRIVIDSLSAYNVMFSKESEQREMLVSLFRMIARWDCTTLVIAEEDQYIHKPHSSIMGFMADAIVKLYTLVTEKNVMVRAMQVFKMRGTKHSFKVFPIDITKKGIVAYTGSNIQ